MGAGKIGKKGVVLKLGNQIQRERKQLSDA